MVCRDVLSEGDVLSALIHEGQMTEAELVATAITLADASNSTTGATIAFAVATLLQDRAQWDSLRTESSAPVGQIVEELLRYTTLVQNNIRIALEDLDLGGTAIKAFETIVISLAAANRDPQVFDEPDRVDATRPNHEQTCHLRSWNSSSVWDSTSPA